MLWEDDEPMYPRTFSADTVTPASESTFESRRLMVSPLYSFINSSSALSFTPIITSPEIKKLSGAKVTFPFMYSEEITVVWLCQRVNANFSESSPLLARLPSSTNTSSWRQTGVFPYGLMVIFAISVSPSWMVPSRRDSIFSSIAP